MSVKAKRINAKIRDEFQRLIAAVGAEEVYQKGASMTKAQMEAHIYKRVVGNPNDDDAVSFAHLLHLGLDPFEVLFETREDGVKVVKSLFIQETDIKIDQITYEVLVNKNFKGKEIISQRALYDKYTQVARNLKKALSHLYKYVDKEDGSIKRSGWNYRDVVDALIQDMWNDLKKCAAINLADSSDEEDDGEDNDDAADKDGGDDPNASASQKQKPPAGWFFPGILFLMLFGPFPWCKNRSDFTQHYDSDPPKSGKKNYGREAIRKAKEDHEAFERGRDTKRGRTTSERVLEQLAAGRVKQAKTSSVETKIFSLHSTANRFSSLISRMDPTNEQYADVLEKLTKVEDQITAAHEELDALNNDYKPDAIISPASTIVSPASTTTKTSTTASNTTTPTAGTGVTTTTHINGNPVLYLA